MEQRIFGRILILLILVSSVDVHAQKPDDFPVAIVVHGGAGTISRENMTSAAEGEYRDKLTEALRAGYDILTSGGTSLDAVTRVVTILEDSPLFNAGVGAVLTSTGAVEHDASIMDGMTLEAGASASTRHVRHPILLARRIMEASPHVMLVGDGAEEFGREQGLEFVENEFFITDRRRAQLRRQQEHRDAARKDEADPGSRETNEQTGSTGAGSTGAGNPGTADVDRFGTVGAVALDRHGNLAAATSTGGTSNKRWGRVGDSPIIGAGTYADNRTCAVSSTGEGEYFIRGVIAYDICATMRLSGLSLVEAANAVIHGKLTEMGGSGGVIAIDRRGEIAMPFNTSGMYRGFIDTEGTLSVKIYRD